MPISVKLIYLSYNDAAQADVSDLARALELNLSGECQPQLSGILD